MIKSTDLHTLFSSFLGVMLAEVIMKPVAARTGRFLIKFLDRFVKIIPNWLWSIENRL